jgi:hypothetical protein
MVQNENHHGESSLGKRIACLVRRDGDQLARKIGLQEASLQFRQGVCTAILSCIATLDAGNSSRNSKIRKELERVHRSATAATKSLWRLHCDILALPPQRSEQLDDWGRVGGKLDLHIIPDRVQWVSVIGNRSWAMAQIVDKGGASPMIGFRVLVESLRLVFKQATGRDGKVTWNDINCKYSGRFVSLAEAVLPLVGEVSGHLGKSLKLPKTPKARAKYIYEMTRKGSTKKRAPRALPKTSNREP